MNVVTGCFMLDIKDNYRVVKNKDRLVIGGHRDKMKHIMVNLSKNVQPSTVSIMLAVASMNNLDVWTSYVRQAYLKCKEPMTFPILTKKLVQECDVDPSLSVKIINLCTV